MSIFSKLKGAKKAADEHKRVQAQASEKAAKAAATTPYRHRPTHAATDALNGSPSGWKMYDSPAIRDAHRKRLSRPESMATMTAYSTSNRGSRIGGEPVAKNFSVGTDITAGSSAPPSSRPSARTSVSFGGMSAPRSQHLGFATYAGLEASQQLHNQQSRFGNGGGPQRRVQSYHGKSPLGSQSESPSVPAHSGQALLTAFH